MRTVFAEALECLLSNKDSLTDFVSHELPLSEAPQGYAMFEKQQARKVVLRP